MLYALERGDVAAKQDALRWAKATLAPEWRDSLTVSHAIRIARCRRVSRPPSSRQAPLWSAAKQSRNDAVESVRGSAKSQQIGRFAQDHLPS